MSPAHPIAGHAAVDVAELRRLHEAATPGSWKADGAAVVTIDDTGYIRTLVDCNWNGSVNRHNAALIAAARNALPALLDMARGYEDMQRENAWSRGLLEEYMVHVKAVNAWAMVLQRRADDLADRLRKAEERNAELATALARAEGIADDRGREHTAAFMDAPKGDRGHATAAAACAHVAEAIKALAARAIEVDRAARLAPAPNGEKGGEHG